MTKKKKSKKTTEPAALELLKQQHQEVEDLFDEFEDAVEAEDSSKARELAASVCEQLTLHAMIEEEIFYPAVRTDETEDQLEEAEVEHVSAKRLIADIASATSDTKLKALMSVLREQVEHHVEEEEETLFPQVQEEIPEDELEPMGQRLEERYEELQARGVGKVELPVAEASDDDEASEESEDEEDAEDDEAETEEDDEDAADDDEADDDDEDDLADGDDDEDEDESEDEPTVESHADMPSITKKPAATKRKR